MVGDPEALAGPESQSGFLPPAAFELEAPKRASIGRSVMWDFTARDVVAILALAAAVVVATVLVFHLARHGNRYPASINMGVLTLLLLSSLARTPPDGSDDWVQLLLALLVGYVSSFAYREARPPDPRNGDKT